jgi:hypothetical protein
LFAALLIDHYFIWDEYEFIKIKFPLYPYIDVVIYGVGGYCL